VKHLIAVLLVLTSCLRPTDEPLADGYELALNDPNFQGKAVFEKLSFSPGFKIVLIDHRGNITDQTIFKYTPYRLDIADVNRDGKTDVLVGLIKSTEFDPIERKRLFILRIDDSQLRPLWLGSKVCQDLINFKALDGGFVQTLEKTRKGNYAIGLYEWQGFGLTLINYVHNEIHYADAFKIFTR
jgi:hypothetical protein